MTHPCKCRTQFQKIFRSNEEEVPQHCEKTWKEPCHCCNGQNTYRDYICNAVKRPEFIVRIDALTERNLVAMRSRAIRPSKARVIEDLMVDLMNVRMKRQKRISFEGKINNMGVII